MLPPEFVNEETLALVTGLLAAMFTIFSVWSGRAAKRRDDAADQAQAAVVAELDKARAAAAESAAALKKTKAQISHMKSAYSNVSADCESLKGDVAEIGHSKIELEQENVALQVDVAELNAMEHQAKKFAEQKIEMVARSRALASTVARMNKEMQTWTQVMDEITGTLDPDTDADVRFRQKVTDACEDYMHTRAPQKKPAEAVQLPVRSSWVPASRDN